MALTEEMVCDNCEKPCGVILRGNFWVKEKRSCALTNGICDDCMFYVVFEARFNRDCPLLPYPNSEVLEVIATAMPPVNEEKFYG